jgi:hypothetical protein
LKNFIVILLKGIAKIQNFEEFFLSFSNTLLLKKATKSDDLLAL